MLHLSLSDNIVSQSGLQTDPSPVQRCRKWSLKLFSPGTYLKHLSAHILPLCHDKQSLCFLFLRMGSRWFPWQRWRDFSLIKPVMVASRSKPASSGTVHRARCSSTSYHFQCYLKGQNYRLVTGPSQDHTMTELVAGRDLWRSPGPSPVTWSWMANTGQCSCGTAQPAPESFKDGGFTPSCPAEGSRCYWAPDFQRFCICSPQPLYKWGYSENALNPCATCPWGATANTSGTSRLFFFSGLVNKKFIHHKQYTPNRLRSRQAFILLAPVLSQTPQACSALH